MVKVCIVCAHPDDELFGAFPLIQYFKNKNYDITLYTIFTYYKDDYTRQKALQNVALNLQIHLELCNLEALSVESINKIIISLDQKLYKKFDIVCTHSSLDLHQDHQVVNRAVQIRFRKFTKIKMFIEFPTLSSTDQSYNQPNFNLYIPLSLNDINYQFFLIKKYYKKEIRYNRTEEIYLSFYKYYGSIIGVNYASPCTTKHLVLS